MFSAAAGSIKYDIIVNVSVYVKSVMVRDCTASSVHVDLAVVTSETANNYYTISNLDNIAAFT